MRAVRRFGAIVAVVMLVLIVGCGKGKSEEGGYYPYAVVKRGDLVLTVQGVGQISTKKFFPISAPFDGKIKYLVPEGTKVKKGDVILKFDMEDAKNNLEDLKMNLLQLENAINNAKIDEKLEKMRKENQLKKLERQVEFQKLKLEELKEEMERKKKLLEKGVLPAKEIEDLKMRILEQEKAVEDAQFALQEYKEELKNEEKKKESSALEQEKRRKNLLRQIKELEDKIAHSELRAETEGVVVYDEIWTGGSLRKPMVGDRVWEGMTIGKIPDMSEVIAVVPINEVDIGKVRLGDEAELTFPAVGTEVYSGKVVAIANVSSSSSRRRWWSALTGSGPKKYDVTISIEKGDTSKLRPDLTVKAKIKVGVLKNVLYVPMEALFDDGENYFVVVKKDGKYEKRTVEVGDFTDEYVEIRKGVEEGEKVLLVNPFEEGERPKTRGKTGSERKFPGGLPFKEMGGGRRG